MKSIIQEKSSIFKAIEEAWIKAKKPKSFSVIVFEEQQKNFLGITTNPAKIGLFFDFKPEMNREEVHQSILTKHPSLSRQSTTKSKCQPKRNFNYKYEQNKPYNPNQQKNFRNKPKPSEPNANQKIEIQQNKEDKIKT